MSKRYKVSQEAYGRLLDGAASSDDGREAFLNEVKRAGGWRSFAAGVPGNHELPLAVAAIRKDREFFHWLLDIGFEPEESAEAMRFAGDRSTAEHLVACDPYFLRTLLCEFGSGPLNVGSPLSRALSLRAVEATLTILDARPDLFERIDSTGKSAVEHLHHLNELCALTTPGQYDHMIEVVRSAHARHLARQALEGASSHASPFAAQ